MHASMDHMAAQTRKNVPRNAPHQTEEPRNAFRPGHKMDTGSPRQMREGRRVVLTDAGRFFAQRARAILVQTDEATDAARRIAVGEQGVLRVGLLESASWAGHVPLALNSFMLRHENIRLLFGR